MAKTKIDLGTVNFFNKDVARNTRKGKNGVETTKEIKGLEKYVALCAARDAIDTLIKTIEMDDVKPALSSEFVTAGRLDGKRPANFHGVEGEAKASCELRKRAWNSSLTPEEVELLNKHKISTEERFGWVINKAYANDIALQVKVSKALSAVEGIPSDFIQPVPVVRTTTNDSLDQLFRLPAKTITELLPIVGTLAIKPAWNGDFDHAMKIAQDLLDSIKSPGDDDEAA